MADPLRRRLPRLSTVAWFGVGTVLLCGAVAVAAGAWWFLTQVGSAPTLTLLNPSAPTVLVSGQGLAVTARAESSLGIRSVDFYVDGELVQSQTPQSGENDVIAVFPWFASLTGPRELQVIALDNFNRASDPASVQVLVAIQANRVLVPDYVWQPAGVDQDGWVGPGQVLTLEEARSGQEGDENGASGGDTPEGLPDLRDQVAEAMAQDEMVEIELADQEGGGADLDDLILPQPDDHPPTLTLFEVFPVRQAENVVLGANATAEDDVGLERFDFGFARDGGDITTHSVACPGETTCTVADMYVLDPGVYYFSARVIDTSGQSSQPDVIMMEVVGRGEEPPAVAVQRNGLELLGRAAAALGDTFQDLRDRSAWLGLLDLAALLEPDQQEQETLGEPVVAVAACVRVRIEPKPEGNLITARITCNETADISQYYLIFTINRRGTHSSDYAQRSVQIHSEGFPGRTTVQEGETFTFLDDRLMCSQSNSYRLAFSWNDSEDGSFPRLFAYADVHNIVNSDCPPGSLGDLGFRAETRPEGVRLDWRLVQSNEWPSVPIRQELTRHRPDVPEWETLLEEEIPGTELQERGAEHSWLDATAECGFIGYFYNLALYRYNELLASSSIEIPRLPCQEGSIGNIEISLTPGYTLDPYPGMPSPSHYTSIFAESEIPAGFPWPAGERVILRMVTADTGRRQPEGRLSEVLITPEVRQRGFMFGNETLVGCGETHYGFHWEMEVDGETVEVGREYESKGPACLPLKPRILRLVGSDSQALCEGAPFCVLWEWEVPEPSIQHATSLPVTGIGLQRSLISGYPQGNERLWIFPLEETSYVDTEIPCSEHSEGTRIRYRIIGMGDPGILGGWTTAVIPLPVCGQPYYEEGTFR